MTRFKFIFLGASLLISGGTIWASSEFPGGTQHNPGHVSLNLTYGSGRIYPRGNYSNGTQDAVRMAMIYAAPKLDVVLRTAWLSHSYFSSPSFQDYGVLIGRQFALSRRFRFSTATGLGVAHGQVKQDESYFTGRYYNFFGIDFPIYSTRTTVENFTVFSLPFEMELMFSPLNHLGIGFNSYGNWNSKSGFLGWGLTGKFEF